MNIFVLDEDIEKCAEYHCDKHVVKMIVESAQMLSTVHQINLRKQYPYVPDYIDMTDTRFYKSTHEKHPCTIWTGKSLSNFLWLKDLTEKLNEQWKLRYNHKRNHKSWEMVKDIPNPDIEDIGLTPFAMAMPMKYQDVNDVVNSYRKYYFEEKSYMAKWDKLDNIPYWFWEKHCKLQREIL